MLVRNLSILEARRAGITFYSVRKACEELKASGDIDAGSSRAEIAAAVVNHLSNQNPQAFGESGLDLDAILAFIEKILPLILMLLGL